MDLIFVALVALGGVAALGLAAWAERKSSKETPRYYVSDGNNAPEAYGITWGYGVVDRQTGQQVAWYNNRPDAVSWADELNRQHDEGQTGTNDGS